MASLSPARVHRDLWFLSTPFRPAPGWRSVPFLLFALLFQLTASGQYCHEQNFDFAIATGERAPGVWYPDRRAPASFGSQETAGGRSGVLKHVIAASGGETDLFRNTQGRKYDLSKGTNSIQAELFIPSDWATTGRRMAGLWGTGADADGNLPQPSADQSYPIIEFTSDGDNPRFRFWQSGDGGGWEDMGLPDGFTYDTWVTLEIALLPGKQFSYKVSTEAGDLTEESVTDHGQSEYIGNIILQGHNTEAGVDYEIYWDNVKAGNGKSEQVTNNDTGNKYCGIQEAIDAYLTDNGHSLAIGNGTYNENVVAHKGVKLVGQSRSGVVIAGQGKASSQPDGITLAANGIELRALTITNHDLGITASNTHNIDGLIIDDVDVTDNRMGLATFANKDAVPKINVFNNIQVTNSDFSRNLHKGLYLERASNVTIDGITMEDTGNGPYPSESGGIDINLKFGSYSNIVVSNSTFTNTAQSTIGVEANPSTPLPNSGGAIQVKARNDGANYGSDPASLTNVIIEGNTIAGANISISAGEPGQPTTGPSDLIVRKNNLAAAGLHKTVINHANQDVALSCNWYGITDIGAIQGALLELGTGKNQLVNYAANGDFNTDNCVGPVHNVTQNEYYTAIQTAIDAAHSGDVITVAAGTYNESVIVHQSVKLRGAQYGEDPRPMSATTRTDDSNESVVTGPKNKPVFDIVAAGVELDGFKIVHTGTGATDAVNGTQEASVRDGATIRNNIITDAGDEGIQMRYTNNLLIERNYIIDPNGEGINISSNRDGSNQKAINNEIVNASSGWGAIYLYGVDDVEISGNYIHGVTNGIHLGDGVDAGNYVTNIRVLANDIKSGFDIYPVSSFGVVVVNSTSADITIANNNIIHVPGSNNPASYLKLIQVYDNPSGIHINNNYLDIDLDTYPGRQYLYVHNSVTNEVDAKCNWWGSDDLSEINSRITADGAVAYSLYLNSGDDGDTDPGFQPTGDCICPDGAGFVTNTNTGIIYCSIQTAIDAATEGDILNVGAGNYTENLTINKSLILEGPNAGTAGTGTRVAEAVLLNTKLTVTGSPTVIIDGFHVLVDNAITGNFFSFSAATEATVQNTIFERNGAPIASTVRAISTSAGTGKKIIKDNLFTGDITGGFSLDANKTWNGAIFVNGKNSDVTIQGNTFRDLRTALNLDDIQDGIKISGNTFDNNNLYFAIGGSTKPAGNYTLAANNFKNLATNFVSLYQVNESFRLDMTNSTYDGTPFGSLPLSKLFEIESKTWHRGRDTNYPTYYTGLVYILPNQQYVVPGAATIQSAVFYAPATSSSDLVTIQDGTYNEQVTVDKSVKLIGESRNGVIIQGQGTASSQPDGITLAADGIELRTLTITNHDLGITASNTHNIDGLIIDDVDLTDNRMGLATFANKDADPKINVFNDIQITNSDFSRNLHKGIYMERGSNVLIDGIVMDDTGNGPYPSESGGIDINLKYGDYSAITISNSSFNNTASSSIGVEANPSSPLPNSGGAIQVKARNDGSNYGAAPATLTGVTIEGNTIAGANINIAAGEPGQPTTGPSNLIVRKNNLESAGLHKTVINHADQDVELSCNWYGITDIVAIKGMLLELGAGKNYLVNYATDAGTSNCFGPVHNVTRDTYYTSIQAAIDAQSTENNDVIRAEAGTYNEQVTIHKSVILKGANAEIAGNGSRAAESVVSGEGVRSGFIITANNVTIDGFKVEQAAGGSFSGVGIYSYGENSGFVIENNIITDNTIGIYPSSNGLATVRHNLIINNNRPGASGGAGLYVEKTNALVIEDNEFSGHLINSAVIFASTTTDAHQSLIFRRNFIHDNNGDNSTLYLTGATNADLSFNKIIGDAVAIRVAEGNQGVIIANNELDGNTAAAVRVKKDGPAATSGITITENSLTGTGLSIDNQESEISVSATCNWFGTSIPAELVSKVNGDVTYLPFTNSGADDNGSAIGFEPTGTCINGPVFNITRSINFATIQTAIDAPQTETGDVIQADAGIYAEPIQVTKNLIFQGANAGNCGTGSRGTETVLIAPAAGGNLINLSGAVSATFTGFKFDGRSIAAVTGANQNLTFRNSVFELDFTPSDNNLYFSSNALTLECNYFQAIGGTNNGGASSHIFFSGDSLTAFDNKFTSAAAQKPVTSGGAFDAATTSLPVWLNLSSNANNVNVHHNEFNQIDLGILVAVNAGNVVIADNEFADAKRQDIPFGNGLGAGIGLFEDLNPSGPILITRNNFSNSEAGIRTAGNGSNFPATDLLTISYNSFTAITEKAIYIGSSYAGAANQLNALCNWFGNVTGPEIATNSGASGVELQDPAGKVSYKNWLMYGADANPSELGFQLPATIAVAPGNNASQAENHYRILSNAIGCAVTGQTIELSGTFDYSGIAQTEWAKGNDGNSVLGDDDYSIQAPRNATNVTITGTATIQGPGDLAAANLESFLEFNNANTTDWEISGLTIKDFDVSLGFYNSLHQSSGLIIKDNTFYIPKDLNETASPEDTHQNIGIHLSYGKNQLIDNNTVYIDGTGESDDSNEKWSTSVFLQSNTGGPDRYDGLAITNNKIHVTGVPASNPAVIRGIWENSNSTTAAISISGNTFQNDDAGNTADLNRQFAFWVTSRSGGGKTVVYQNNEVSGFSEGISWLGGAYTPYPAPVYQNGSAPVEILNNKFDQVKNGVVVRKLGTSTHPGSPALIHQNSFTNLVEGGFAIVNEGTGETDASCNWFDNPLASTVISSTGGGSVSYQQKLILGVDNDLAAVGFQTTATCELPVVNEDTGDDYLTIQAAVDDAAPGNIIRVSTGIYPENVTVDKGVTIYGVDSTLVIVDKGNYGSGAGTGFFIAADNVTLKSMKVQNFNFGVGHFDGAPIAALTLEELNLNNNFGAGFISNRSIAGLTIHKSNLNNNGNKDGIISSSAYKRGILLQSSSADYSNIVITDNTVNGNGLTGIDINLNQSMEGVTITGNTVKSNADAQISAWLGNTTPASAAVLIQGNTLELDGTSRFGIEAKNMSGTGAASGTGSVVIDDNTISVAGTHAGSDRDMAGIAVIRRKDGSANDQPQGVVVSNNTINDFQNSHGSGGDAFGIVIGGTGHRVANNTIDNTQYAIQLQKGNENYDNDGNSSSTAGQPNNYYFDRDNSNDACAELVDNAITNSGAERLVTGASAIADVIPLTRVTNTDLGGTKFCTIQQGIDFVATADGHTLDAEAGTYPENVVVNKSLTIAGPNAGTAGADTRAAEAIVIPATEAIADGKIFTVTANEVTIKGFTISGSNTDLSASLVLNGVNTHAAHGIYAEGDLDRLVIEDNIIANFTKNGVALDAGSGSTYGNSIHQNLFDNIPRHTANDGGFYGRGVSLANNFYASVTDNTFTRVERGIQTNNFWKAIEAGDWEIKGNTIQAYNIGSFINLHYQNASDLTFEANNIEKEAAARVISAGDALPDAIFTGIEIFSVQNTVNVLVKGGTIKDADEGIYSWHNPTTRHVTIDGVSFENNTIAVLQSNYSRYSNAADTEIDVINVTLAAGDAEKAFIAEDHASGSGKLSSINVLNGNAISNAYPFHIRGGSQARIRVANSTVTLAGQDAFTFDFTGTSDAPNVVIGEGVTVDLNSHDLRVIELPQGAILEIAGDFSAPSKVGKNPVLINGSIWFTSGILHAGDGNIEFGNDASDILTGAHKENSASYILGKAAMLSRAVNTGALDFLGVNMPAGANVGNLVITRTTSVSGSIDPAFVADNSIRTVWDIQPSASNANRNNVQLRYLNITDNVNNQDPAMLYAYRYNTVNQQWEKKSAQLNSTAADDVSTTDVFGIVEFSSWTLSSAEPGPDLKISDIGIYATSNITNTTQLRNLVVRISEINGFPTLGDIPVQLRVTIPAGIDVTFDPAATTLSGQSVDNTNWERYNETSTSFIYLRYTGGSITANGNSAFGITFQAAPSVLNGSKPITTSILTSGNDNNSENNLGIVSLSVDIP